MFIPKFLLCIRNVIFLHLRGKGSSAIGVLISESKFSISDVLVAELSSTDSKGSPFLQALKDTFDGSSFGGKLLIFPKNKRTSMSCSVDHFKWLVLFWFCYSRKKMNIELVKKYPTLIQDVYAEYVLDHHYKICPTFFPF